MADMSRRGAAARLAGLAVLSALLTNFAATDPWDVLQIGTEPDHVLLLPGAYFGAVLAVGLALAGRRQPAALAAAFAAALLAWILAWKTGYRAYVQLERLAPAANALGPAETRTPVLLAGAGFVAGIVGSLITVAGVSLADRRLRSAAGWTGTVAIGALAGLLLGANAVLESMLPLFLAWQPAVAGSIAYALARPGARQAVAAPA